VAGLAELLRTRTRAGLRADTCGVALAVLVCLLALPGEGPFYGRFWNVLQRPGTAPGNTLGIETAAWLETNRPNGLGGVLFTDHFTGASALSFSPTYADTFNLGKMKLQRPFPYRPAWQAREDWMVGLERHIAAFLVVDPAVPLPAAIYPLPVRYPWLEPGDALLELSASQRFAADYLDDLRARGWRVTPVPPHYLLVERPAR